MQRGRPKAGNIDFSSSAQDLRDRRGGENDLPEDVTKPAIVSSSSATADDQGDGACCYEPKNVAGDSDSSQGTKAVGALAAAFHDVHSPAVRAAIDTAGLFAIQPHCCQMQASYQREYGTQQITDSAIMAGLTIPPQAQLFYIRPMALLLPIPQVELLKASLLQTNTSPGFPNLAQYARDPTAMLRVISPIMAPSPLLGALEPRLLQPYIDQRQELRWHGPGQYINHLSSTSSAMTSPSYPGLPFAAAAFASPITPAPSQERHQGIRISDGAAFRHIQPPSSFPDSSSAHTPAHNTGSPIEMPPRHTMQSNHAPCKPGATKRKRSAVAGEKGKKDTARVGVDGKVSAHIDRRTNTDSTQGPPKKNKKVGHLKETQAQGQQGTAIPLIMPGDKEWLTKKECFLRINCFELFSATEGDISSNTSGRRNPVALGQVGIRCVYCAKLPASMRAQRSMCFPSSIRTIQKAFTNLVHLHFPECTHVPCSVRATYESFKSSHSPMGSNEYRIESMEKVLVDVGEAGGVRFKDNISANNLPDAPGTVLFGSDKKFVTDFAFLLFGQMQKCTFSSRDSAKSVYIHKVGYTGLACAHCSKAAVMEGRFFPNSPQGLSSLYDAGEIYAHISNCPNTPQDVKDELLEMKEKDGDQLKKLKAGSTNSFFQRVWLRLHKSFNGKVYNSDGVVVD